MLLGVLDIGSNSAQLQVFEVRPGAPAGVGRVINAVNHAMCAPRRLGVQQLDVWS